MTIVAPPALLPDRLVAVDFWRGLALLMIFINHISGNPLQFATTRVWGFSDSAEIFVFLAGFSVVLAYDRAFAQGGFLCGALRVLRRAWQLFCAHVLLIVALSVVVITAAQYTDGRHIMEQMNFSPFFSDTDVAVLQLVKLKYMPNMTDILPLYVVFLAAYPVFWLIRRLSLALLVALSFALWLWVNITGFSVQNYPDGAVWFLNPLAWQLLFILGIAAAQHRGALSRWVRQPGVLPVALLFLAFSVIAAAPWTHHPPFRDFRIIPPEILSINNKGNISAIRLLHFLALAVVAVRWLPPAASFWQTPFARAVSICGRRALPVYCGGVVLALSIHSIVYINQMSKILIVIQTLGGLGLLMLFAWGLEHSRIIRRRCEAPRRQPA